MVDRFVVLAETLRTNDADLQLIRDTPRILARTRLVPLGVAQVAHHADALLMRRIVLGVAVRWSMMRDALVEVEINDA